MKMDFARKQLEKYGWSEGKGLGKSENGILKAIKPKPKHGQGGIGLDIAEEFTNHWWQKIYNNAADNIKVNKNKKGEIKNFSTERGESIDITTKTWVKSKESKNSKLSNTNSKMANEYMDKFINSATLTNGVTMVVNKKSENGDDSSDSESDNAKLMLNNQKLSDEELFSACGGRTAHKGARHGIKSNGKLARINKQEDKFLEKMKTIYKNTQKTPAQQSNHIDKIDCDQEKKSLQNTDNNPNDQISEFSDRSIIFNDNEPKSVQKMKKNRKRKIGTYSNVAVCGINLTSGNNEPKKKRRKRKKNIK